MSGRYDVVRVVLPNMFREIGVPPGDVPRLTSSRRRNRRPAPRVVGKFPGEHIGMIGIAGDDVSGEILESIDYSLVDKELIMLLGTTELPNVEIDSAIIIAESAPWERVVGSRCDVASAEAEDAERIRYVRNVISQRSWVPVVRERELYIDAMFFERVP